MHGLAACVEVVFQLGCRARQVASKQSPQEIKPCAFVHVETKPKQRHMVLKHLDFSVSDCRRQPVRCHSTSKQGRICESDPMSSASSACSPRLMTGSSHMLEPMTLSHLRGSEMTEEMTANEASDKASLSVHVGLPMLPRSGVSQHFLENWLQNSNAMSSSLQSNMRMPDQIPKTHLKEKLFMQHSHLSSLGTLFLRYMKLPFP